MFGSSKEMKTMHRCPQRHSVRGATSCSLCPGVHHPPLRFHDAHAHRHPGQGATYFIPASDGNHA